MSERILNVAAIEGREISFLERGVGPENVICLPGWPMGKTMYVKMLECVQPNSSYGFIALDYPGWGRSELIQDELNYNTLGSVVIGFLEAKNIKKAHLLGVSFGAALGLNIADQYPDRVESVIASAPPVLYRRHIESRQQLAFEVCNKFPGIKKWFHGQLMQGKNWAWKVVFNDISKINNDPFSQQVFGEVRGAEFRALDESLGQIIATDIRGILPRINVPVLLLTGSRDYMLEDSREAATKIPNVRLKVLEGGNHDMVAKMPEEFMKNVIDFLNET